MVLFDIYIIPSSLPMKVHAMTCYYIVLCLKWH